MGRIMNCRRSRRRTGRKRRTITETTITITSDGSPVTTTTTTTITGITPILVLVEHSLNEQRRFRRKIRIRKDSYRFSPADDYLVVVQIRVIQFQLKYNEINGKK
jgi:hypothetical protein